MGEDSKIFLDNLWRWKCGLPEIDYYKNESKKVDYSDYRATEWSKEFEQLMRNRLIMGAIRYGRMGHGSTPKGKPNYDRVKSIRKRLKFFEKTGNAEWLVDIANLVLLIFEEKQHPNFNFKPEDDGYHDEIK